MGWMHGWSEGWFRRLFVTVGQAARQAAPAAHKDSGQKAACLRLPSSPQARPQVRPQLAPELARVQLAAAVLVRGLEDSLHLDLCVCVG